MQQAIRTPYDKVAQTLAVETGSHRGEVAVPVLMQLTGRALSDRAAVDDLWTTAMRNTVAPRYHAFSPDLDRALRVMADHAGPLDAAEAGFVGRVIVYLVCPTADVDVDAVLAKFLGAMTLVDGHVQAPLLEALWIGPMVVFAPDGTGRPLTGEGMRMTLDEATDAPVVGIIDDGIGYLNAAFRTPGQDRTRIDALWQMHRPRRHAGGIDLGLDPLTGDDIDARIGDLRAGQTTEGQVYYDDNLRLYAHDSYHGTNTAVTHGTHMLDLICQQFRPSFKTAHRDILAVQLPPFSIRDTSGDHLSFFAYVGLRLMLWRMREGLGAGQDCALRPLVLNVSLGMLAGPKDGSGHFQREFEREVAAYEAATGGTVTAFFAYGNAYGDRQLATATIAPKSDVAFKWRNLPEDRTASFMEIRATGPVELGLIAPGEAAPHHWVAPGMGQTTALKGAHGDDLGWALGHASAQYDEAGSLVWDEDGVVMALRPTSPDLGDAAFRAGLWTVVVRSVCHEDVDITAQIQSGSTPPGYAPHGRQSYFESPQTDAAVTVTDAGSYTALAPQSGGAIKTVAAAAFGGASPMGYSSQGGTFAVNAAPDVSVVVEDRFLSGGVLAAGTRTGLVARAGGTSAAAAIAAGLEADRITRGDPVPDWTDPQDDRLGRAVLHSKKATPG